MLGFFEKGLTWKQCMQGGNAVAFSVALFYLTTDPETKAASLCLDLATHAYSIWCLQDNPGFGHRLTGSSLNLVRFGEILGGFTSGISSSSLLVAIIDMIEHLANAGGIIINFDDNKVSASPKSI